MKKTVAEISLQPNGDVLVKRNRPGKKSIRPYTPTPTSRLRVEEFLDTCYPMMSGWYFYRK